MNLCIAIRQSKKRDVVAKLVDHYADLLGLHRHRIDVVVDTVTGYTKEHGAYGGVFVEGKHVTVALDSDLTKFQTILVLAHELIHARQAAIGKLSYQNGRAHWCGRDMHDLPYEQKPWEIQAHREMGGLICLLGSRIMTQ